jgi:spore coat protein CotH
MDHFDSKQDFKTEKGTSTGLKEFKFREPVNCFSKDDSYMNEKLVSDLMISAGVLTTRIAYTDLYVNDIYFGLYLVEEGISKRYFNARASALTKKVFNSTTGKMKDVYGEMLEYTKASEMEKTKAIYERMKNISTIHEINSEFYLHSFNRMLFVNAISCNWDAFPYNNYELYKHPYTGKWIPIFHDYDLSLYSEATRFNLRLYWTCDVPV